MFQKTLLWELINTNKQTREVKPILSDTVGKSMPRLKKKILLNNNKLIWILSGQLYNSPKRRS
jgi:hypothetical protein